MALTDRLGELDRRRDAVLSQSGKDFLPALKAHIDSLKRDRTHRQLDELRSQTEELIDEETRADEEHVKALTRARDHYLAVWEEQFATFPLSEQALRRNEDFDECLEDSTFSERHRAVWNPRSGVPWRAEQLEGILSDIVSLTAEQLPAQRTSEQVKTLRELKTMVREARSRSRAAREHFEGQRLACAGFDLLDVERALDPPGRSPLQGFVASMSAPDEDELKHQLRRLHEAIRGQALSSRRHRARELFSDLAEFAGEAKALFIGGAVVVVAILSGVAWLLAHLIF